MDEDNESVPVAEFFEDEDEDGDDECAEIID